MYHQEVFVAKGVQAVLTKELPSVKLVVGEHQSVEAFDVAIVRVYCFRPVEKVHMLLERRLGQVERMHLIFVAKDIH